MLNDECNEVILRLVAVSGVLDELLLDTFACRTLLKRGEAQAWFISK
eukprot:COSAG06_NODE_48071_length_334_cov_5.127660_1_plen_47_part_00